LQPLDTLDTNSTGLVETKLAVVSCSEESEKNGADEQLSSGATGVLSET